MMLCMMISLIIHAQSDSLLYTYKQVCKTLCEYRLLSKDAETDNGKTISIQFQIKDGCYIFSFNDDFKPFNDSFYGNRHGTKTIKVPIKEINFDLWYYGGRMYVEGKNGLELEYKGKKELIKSYYVEGEDLSVEKLYKELQQLHAFVVEEDFNGPLNNGTVFPSKKVVHKTPNRAKKETSSSAQPQQRKRNRVPFGN